MMFVFHDDGQGRSCSYRCHGDSVVIRVVRMDPCVRTQLCVLSKCGAIEVDMINPKDWPKWMCGSIALHEPPKISWGYECSLSDEVCSI